MRRLPGTRDVGAEEKLDKLGADTRFKHLQEGGGAALSNGVHSRLVRGDALREMHGKYIGNRPVKVRKSTWKER
eukprot:1657629-Pleurochrysis_carterae.AAC.1